MILLAIAVLPLVLIGTGFLETAFMDTQTARLIDDIIWMIFLLEYIVMITLSSDKKQYFKNNKLLFFIIILTPPLIVPDTASAFRVLRVARVLRLLIVVEKGIKPLMESFTRDSFNYILIYSITLVAISGIVFSVIEEIDIFDGIWWAITTVTTVGYGDMYPTSDAGRVVAFLVMIVGIGFVSVLTAAIAAHFVDIDQDDTNEELIAKLDDLDEHVQHLSGQIKSLENELDEYKK
ncbi:potassium channel family protein [Methanosalsum natronophilum]|uniref:potassium channel family protein n=1 Tax=Methanosalsum natronophilum TaxID=768733 RepID=UPI00216A0134|nr:potassium channel family protein [Methanosalsum natronophilum]MCS3924535.1 voltage-gated potassium channel [Methanosalsum natronophilum]